MAQQVVLKARGLYTFQNQLSEIPEGALLEALNCIIDRNGIIQKRRGFMEGRLQIWRSVTSSF